MKEQDKLREIERLEKVVSDSLMASAPDWSTQSIAKSLYDAGYRLPEPVASKFPLSKCCGAEAIKSPQLSRLKYDNSAICVKCGKTIEPANTQPVCPKCGGTGTFLDPNGRTAGDCPICRPFTVPEKPKPVADEGTCKCGHAKKEHLLPGDDYCPNGTCCLITLCPCLEYEPAIPPVAPDDKLREKIAQIINETDDVSGWENCNQEFYLAQADSILALIQQAGEGK